MDDDFDLFLICILVVFFFGCLLMIRASSEEKAYCHTKVVKTIQVDEQGNETTVTRKTSTC